MVTYLGSLVQSCCGEGGTLQTNITDVCGEYSQCLGHTGFAPATRCVCLPNLVFSGSSLFCRRTVRWALGCMHFPGLSRSGSGSWVLHKGTDSVGPAFCALPRSVQFRRPGVWRAQSPPGERCILSPPPSQPLGYLGVRRHAFSGVPCVSSVELISGCDPPGGCQPSRIPRSLD